MPVSHLIDFFPDALSVDVMAVYFTDVILGLPPKERESAGVQLPVSHTTAWRWMHALGARYGAFRFSLHIIIPPCTFRIAQYLRMLYFQVFNYDSSM